MAISSTANDPGQGFAVFLHSKPFQNIGLRLLSKAIDALDDNQRNVQLIDPVSEQITDPSVRAEEGDKDAFYCLSLQVIPLFEYRLS
jgi:hypothetical protein